MKLKFLIYLLSFLSFSFFFACSPKDRFTIEGTVLNGEGKMLYLENVGVNSLIIVDSVRINKNQTFLFRAQNTTGAPDFYRIRLKNQFINIVVDSTETIAIHTDTLNFAKNYTIEESPENQKIRELTLLQVQTNASYNKIIKQYETKEIDLDKAVEQSDVILNAYKDKAKEIIISDPGSASAYFALFQQVNDLLIFHPYEKNDSRIYGTVANSWNLKYSDAQRTQHLVAIYKEALSEFRKQNFDMKPLEVSVMKALDFTLNSPLDLPYTLSEVAEGRVLLLDFTSYEMKESPAHILQLADVYEKYHGRGFEILQVSLDADLHFWKNAAINLPWICVIDPESVYSELLRKFNVQTIPCGFLFDKEGDIVSRIEDYSKLDSELRPLLK